MQPQNRTRILIVLPQLHQGGVERHISYIVRNLDRSRYEVHIGYFKDKVIFFDSLLAHSDFTHRIQGGDKTSFKTFIELIKTIRKVQPDIVHFVQASANILGGFSSYFTTEYPLIYTFFTSRRPWYYHGLYWMIRNRAAASICNSRLIKKELIERSRYCDKTIHVIENFLDTESFHPFSKEKKIQARKELGFDQQDLLLASVGRLSYQKNQLGTINAIKYLRATNQLPANFRMILIGHPEKPDYSEQVRKESADLQRDGVCIIREPTDNPVELYNAVDGIFQPSHFEGLSNVVIEAQASGSVVALSKESDNDNLIEHMHNGISFSVGDVASIADGLLTLIKSCQNSEFKERLQQNARETACRRFSIRGPLLEFERVYEAALTSARCKKPRKSQVLTEFVTLSDQE